MDGYTTIGGIVRDLARDEGLNVRPQDVSALFYKRLVPDDRCTIMGGRRLIPIDLVPGIVAILRQRGLVRPREEGGAA